MLTEESKQLYQNVLVFVTVLSFAEYSAIKILNPIVRECSQIYHSGTSRGTMWVKIRQDTSAHKYAKIFREKGMSVPILQTVAMHLRRGSEKLC